MTTTGNKRIAINTAVLYIKLIISIVISFLTTRLVLEALGASDYGLYNVVGGIVGLLNILSTSMVATSYRYMAVEIGKGSSGNPRKVFNTIFVIHSLLAILLLIFGETVGVFYITNYLNVDVAKVDDALFIFHLSLLTTAFVVITIPTNGLLIAREKFIFTSLIDIISIFLRLGFVLALANMECNRLRAYASFLAVIQFLTPLSYQLYCRLTEKDIVKWEFNRCIKDYTSMLGFAAWMLIGALACVARVQGAAIIINLFFGTVLNAAFGLASNVFSAANSFTTTLRQAAIPQIMKGQAAGDEDGSLKLVYYISKYSYLLMLVPAIPLITCVDGTLHLWLGTPPEYTAIFVILMLINGMISNLSAGFDASIQATGKVRKNQIGYSIINLSLLPLIYILYKLGLPPYINGIVMIVLTIVTLLFQCGIMKELTKFDARKYIDFTIKPSILTTIIALIPLLFITRVFDDSWIQIVLSLVVALLWTLASIYLIGMSKTEKSMINNIISTKLLKRHTALK